MFLHGFGLSICLGLVLLIIMQEGFLETVIGSGLMGLGHLVLSERHVGFVPSDFVERGLMSLNLVGVSRAYFNRRVPA